MGRGTLASGHSSFPLITVAVPVVSAECFLSFAFAAHRPWQGNNANSNLFAAAVTVLKAPNRRLTTYYLLANGVPIWEAMCFHFPIRPQTPEEGSCKTITLKPSTAHDLSYAFRNALPALTATIVSVGGRFHRQQAAEHPGGLEVLSNTPASRPPVSSVCRMIAKQKCLKNHGY